MTIKETLCAMVAATIIGLGGCKKQEKVGDTTLYGKPISAVYVYNNREPSTFTGVFDVGGKLLLAYRHLEPYEDSWNAKALAVVQSEINDGDNERVKLLGHFTNSNLNEFKLSALEANGFLVDFNCKKPIPWASK